MVMHNPPHPGKVIRELCLEPLGLSVNLKVGLLIASQKVYIRWSLEANR